LIGTVRQGRHHLDWAVRVGVSGLNEQATNSRSNVRDCRFGNIAMPGNANDNR